MDEAGKFKVPTTCVECGARGEEIRDKPTAIIHKTILCDDCKAKLDREKQSTKN